MVQAAVQATQGSMAALHAPAGLYHRAVLHGAVALHGCTACCNGAPETARRRGCCRWACAPRKSARRCRPAAGQQTKGEVRAQRSRRQVERSRPATTGSVVHPAVGCRNMHTGTTATQASSSQPPSRTNLVGSNGDGQHLHPGAARCQQVRQVNRPYAVRGAQLQGRVQPTRGGEAAPSLDKSTNCHPAAPALERRERAAPLPPAPSPAAPRPCPPAAAWPCCAAACPARAAP